MTWIKVALLFPRRIMNKNGNDSDSYDENEYKVIVRSTDMSNFQQMEAARIITEALTIHQKETQVAKMVKTYFDEKHGRAWHCIVGKHFASNADTTKSIVKKVQTYVTHEVNTYILVHVGQVSFMIRTTHGCT
ncbi:hypothetical protein ACTXT7_009867 [Hymenolepis weldensis]